MLERVLDDRSWLAAGRLDELEQLRERARGIPHGAREGLGYRIVPASLVTSLEKMVEKAASEKTSSP